MKMVLGKYALRNLLRRSALNALRADFMKKSVRKFAGTPFEDKLYQIPFARIQPEGEGRYMLMLAYNHGETGLGRLIVRGSTSAKNHKEIYKAAQKEIEEKELCILPKGGGYLVHKPDECYIEIFGKSKEYGKADHLETQDILAKAYPTTHVWVNRKK